MECLMNRNRAAAARRGMYLFDVGVDAVFTWTMQSIPGRGVSDAGTLDDTHQDGSRLRLPGRVLFEQVQPALDT